MIADSSGLRARARPSGAQRLKAGPGGLMDPRSCWGLKVWFEFIRTPPNVSFVCNKDEQHVMNEQLQNSVRAACVTVLQRHNIEDRHIASVTMHKNISSLASYGRPSDQQKIVMQGWKNFLCATRHNGTTPKNQSPNWNQDLKPGRQSRTPKRTVAKRCKKTREPVHLGLVKNARHYVQIVQVKYLQKS